MEDTVMYSFLMNDEVCPRCKGSLVGEGTVRHGDNLYSVNESLRVVENISNGNDLNDTDVILDYKWSIFRCSVCLKELDVSHNPEE